MRRKALVAGAVALTVSSACEPPLVKKSAFEHGQALFATPGLGLTESEYACTTCHDGASVAPGLRKVGAPLAGVTERPSFWGGSEVDLLRAVNHCVVDFLGGTAFQGSEVEAEALWAYLDGNSEEGAGAEPVSFTTDPTPPNLTAGDAAAGAPLYDAVCATCHGAAFGASAPISAAPLLPEQTLAEHPPPEYTPEEQRFVFIQKTRYGRYYNYGGRMPPVSLEVLSDSELADLLAYLGL